MKGTRWLIAAAGLFSVTLAWGQETTSRAPGTDFRALTWNIWGDYFGNPPSEREDAIAAVLTRYAPDAMFLQEITPNWHKAKLFNVLADEYGMVGADETCYTPLLYRKAACDLLDSGFELFHPKLDKSKGFAWAALKLKSSGRTIIVFSTHFWWQSGAPSDYIRTVNASDLRGKLEKLRAKWQCPVVGGGDFNCESASDQLRSFVADGYANAQFACADASAVSSEHGNPVRGTDKKYHGKPTVPNYTKNDSIDHVLYTAADWTPLRQRLVLDQDAMDSSDHSPDYADLKFK